MTQKYNIAVAGATGAVGTEIVQILEQRDFTRIIKIKRQKSRV